MQSKGACKKCYGIHKEPLAFKVTALWVIDPDGRSLECAPHELDVCVVCVKQVEQTNERLQGRGFFKGVTVDCGTPLV